MIKRYAWKILMADGVLAEPGEFGDVGRSKEPLNRCGGFLTECEAYAQFERLAKDYAWLFNDDYVLIAFYTRR